MLQMKMAAGLFGQNQITRYNHLFSRTRLSRKTKLLRHIPVMKNARL